MIKLEVMPYCHGCDLFRPQATCPEVMRDFFGNKTFIADVVVRCVDHERCEMISEYLKEKKNDQT